MTARRRSRGMQEVIVSSPSSLVRIQEFAVEAGQGEHSLGHRTRISHRAWKPRRLGDRKEAQPWHAGGGGDSAACMLCMMRASCACCAHAEHMLCASCVHALYAVHSVCMPCMLCMLCILCTCCVHSLHATRIARAHAVLRMLCMLFA